MQELIEAAKAVVDLYAYTGTVEECEAVNRLYDAVERAESDKVDRDDDLFAACMYGAKTERERIKEIVRKAIPEKLWVYRQAIVEKIDDL